MASLNDIKRILVIDDSSTVCNFISTGLSSEGFQAISALSMQDALLVRGDQVHVVLTDIFMPGMDGFEGITEIRRRWNDVSIIAMSGGFNGMGRDDTLIKARRCGADVVLQKPFKIERLVEKINYLLQQKTTAQGRKLRVLVVEDSGVQRKLISRMILSCGYEVFDAETMEAALDSTDIIGVDLLVTDIFMPGEGGLAGIGKIRNIWPNIRVIAMSGGWSNEMAGEQTLKAAGMVGADATLKKPFNQETLEAALNKALQS